jgi:Zn-dependent protease with chaperone function
MLFLVMIASFSAAVLMTISLNRLAIIPWNLTAGQHWTERARQLWPARIGAKLLVLIVPGICVMAGGMFWRDDQPALWLFGVFGWLGAMFGTYPFDRKIQPWLNFRDWLHQVCASLLLRLAWLPIFIGAALAMPDQFGLPTVLLAGAVLLVKLSLNAGLAVWLLKRLRILVPPSERLQRIVVESAKHMGVAAPKVWLLKRSVSNAAALPFTGELIFSERLMELHPDDEINAICAHELGHLGESRLVLAGRLLGSLTLFPLLFLKPALHASNGDGGLALASLALATMALSSLGRRLSRKMEVRADKVAKDNQAGDGIYARALERLYEANQIPAVMRGNRMAHPHLYDRMLAAGIPPEYPRPRPPGPAGANIVIGIMLLIVLLALGHRAF